METDKDAIAAGNVALSGVMALCNVLAEANLLDRAGVEGIGEFMLDSVDRSQASEAMQAHLREAISKHVSTLLSRFGPRR